MKRLYIFLTSLLLAAAPVAAQQITGQWFSLLRVPGAELRLAFVVEEASEGYTCHMFSLDQGGDPIPCSFSFDAPALTIECAPLQMSYRGEIKENGIVEGTFRQVTLSEPLILYRTPEAAGWNREIVRPQDPQPPFPYRVEEVTVRNEQAGIALAGTLTLPESDTPAMAVLLFSGTGPQNRDSEIFDHRPFAVIADYLTREGIAVLRMDDRGVGRSGGDYAPATLEDFATDALAGIEYLRGRPEINPGKAGIIGHSQGGYTALMVSAQTALPFIVTLAGPGVNGTELVAMQTRALMEAQGFPAEAVEGLTTVQRQMMELAKSDLTIEQMEEQAREITAGTPVEEQSGAMLRQFTSAELRSFLRYDPAEDMRRIVCPVLALNGEKDLQVPFEANLKGLYEGITAGGNPNVTIKSYPHLNHLFQQSKTGLPAEYKGIDETFNTEVLRDIACWLQAL